MRIFIASSLLGVLALHGFEASVTAPARYPDLYAVMFAAYSCAHFVVAYCASVYLQWTSALAAAGRDEHTPMDFHVSTYTLRIWDNTWMKGDPRSRSFDADTREKTR